MLGWKIFSQAVNQIYSNFGMAIRLSAVIWVGIFAISISLTYLITGRFPNEGLMAEFAEANTSGFVWSWNKFHAFLAMMIVYFVGVTSIAVSWHRFILLDETSSSLLPNWIWNRTKRYIIMSLKIGFVIVAVGFLFWLIIVFIASFGILKSNYLLIGLGFMVAMVSSYLWLRISLALPSAALGVDHNLGNSWDLTQSIKGALWVLLIILMVLGILLGDGLRLVTANKTVLYVVSFLTEWIVLMVGVGVLTVLYGHLVEKREL